MEAKNIQFPYTDSFGENVNILGMGINQLIIEM